MYEKTINGKLMSKASPGSAWEPLSHAELNRRLIAKDAELARMAATLDGISVLVNNFVQERV